MDPLVEPEAPPASAAPPGAPADAAAEFGALYAAHAPAIYYLALRLLGDPARAEDATHDVFLRAWRHYGEFRRAASARTWLYRIALNHCRNLQQRWYDRARVPAAEAGAWENAPDPGAGPLRVLELRELGRRIQQTLDALPAEYRELLLLVADEQLTYQQVAELTHQTADAVRGKLHRARRAFAAAFARTA